MKEKPTAAVRDWIIALTCVWILLLTGVPSPAQNKQQVWFQPQAPGAWPDGRTGPVDYMDMFTPAAPWSTAASHIQVFEFPNSAFAGNLSGALSDGQWQQVFSDLARRGIALAIQWGPLSVTTCGTGVEGFEGNSALTTAQKVKRLGGTLQYIELDEPFYYANIYSGQNACLWTPQQIAVNAAQSIALIRTVFPNVIVGEAEPIAPPGTSDWLQKYAAWFDAFKAATGIPLAFFHCDVNWEADPNWISDVNSILPVLAARGIIFGIFYNDLSGETPGSTTDAAWMQAAESHFLDYEVNGGTLPSQPVFSSWRTYPTHVLPETDPDALTYLVDYYFRQRTSLSLRAATYEASGKLQDTQGNLISAAPVVITLQPVSGPGIVSTYTLTGTVPAPATTFVMQICVNECGGTAGSNDMSIYSFQYADPGTNTTQNLSKGLQGWNIEPPSQGGTASVQLSSDSTGPSVLIHATAAQQTYINSDCFAATPGDTFSLAIKARISPASSGSGRFSVGFFNGCYTKGGVNVPPIVALPFAPAVSNLGTALTGNDGSYSLVFPLQSAPGLQLQASFAGSTTLWPAFASALVDDTPAINLNGIVNAADFQAEPLSPGAWFTIFGQNLGEAGTWTTPDTTTVGGAAVSVCGLPADISYNSGLLTANASTSWQLNALVPDGVVGQTSCPVVVSVSGLFTQASSVVIKAGVMELFGFASSVGTLPLVTHADYSLVGPAAVGLTPAKPNETVIAWGTGDCAPPSVTVEGASAVVAFSGRVGPGLCQINLVLPNGPAGSDQLRLSSSPNPYSLWVSP